MPAGGGRSRRRADHEAYPLGLARGQLAAVARASPAFAGIGEHCLGDLLETDGLRIVFFACGGCQAQSNVQSALDSSSLGANVPSQVRNDRRLALNTCAGRLAGSARSPVLEKRFDFRHP